jgi:hypothetical protein
LFRGTQALAQQGQNGDMHTSNGDMQTSNGKAGNKAAKQPNADGEMVSHLCVLECVSLRNDGLPRHADEAHSSFL